MTTVGLWQLKEYPKHFSSDPWPFQGIEYAKS
jgi:hypothetical protein